MELISIPHLVIGGGLAGIAIAQRLAETRKPFLLLEAEAHLGGKIETRRTPEGCFELGPHSFTLKSPAMRTLIDRLGLENALLAPSPAAHKRYLLKKGRIVRLPGKPSELLGTRALSFRGKCRLLAEYFHVPEKPCAPESVMQFFTRHFGREVAETIADPFVSGIFAGDAHTLAMNEAFPALVDAEVQSRSLLRHMMKAKKRNSEGTIYQLRGGLAELFQSAYAQLGPERIHLGEKAFGLRPVPSGFEIETIAASYQCKHLYLTAPAYAAAELLHDPLPRLASALSRIDYPELVALQVKLPKHESYPFDGFGLLISRSEQRFILGTLWDSSAFPDLFSDKTHHYLTIYCGGARQREISNDSDRDIADRALEELREIFALNSHPQLMYLKRHRRAIPQYTFAYSELKATILHELERLPTLHLAGNYLGGISMPDTVAYAEVAACRTKD